jgi:glucose-6-phosphate-specific signal transduction histidine kinase
MLGLLLSGLLVFGRFGWMGKIAGALMGMMLIGSNSQSQSVAQTQEVTQSTGLKR